MHTKTNKILMRGNEQRPELGLSHEKRELRNHTHENQELRSWSNVHEKKSSGIVAVTFLPRLCSFPHINILIVFVCIKLNEK